MFSKVLRRDFTYQNHNVILFDNFIVTIYAGHL